MQKTDDKVFIFIDDNKSVAGVLKLKDGKISPQNYRDIKIDSLRVNRCPNCYHELCSYFHCHYCSIDWEKTPDYIKNYLKGK